MTSKMLFCWLLAMGPTVATEPTSAAKSQQAAPPPRITMTATGTDNTHKKRVEETPKEEEGKRKHTHELLNCV